MVYNFGIVIPMANEEKDFYQFISALIDVLDKLECGLVYLVIDKVSKDNTLKLSKQLSAKDKRFLTVWAPENKNLVDAYLRGYKEAIKNKHDYIIEMDAGLSHDPRAIPMFLRVLNEGNECAFGSRFINGGSLQNFNWKRKVLSKLGTVLSNLCLGTSMHDMTSGYQGFHCKVVKQFTNYEFLSIAHFYQTELRYILRNSRYMEVPIHYRAPSPNVSKKSILNSVSVLFHYFFKRIYSKPACILKNN